MTVNEIPPWQPPPRMATQDEVEALRRRVDMLEALVLRLDQGMVEKKARTVPPPSTPSETVRFSEIMVDPDPDWLPIRHSIQRPNADAPKPCGGVALYLTEPPQEHKNARLDVMRVRVPHSSVWMIPDPDDQRHEPRCAACLAPIDPFSGADLDYLSHMLPADDPTTRKPKPDAQRKPRRRSGEDRGGGVVVPSQPPGVLSPGAQGVDTGLPSTFSGLTHPGLPHATRELNQQIDRGISELQRLADVYRGTPT